MQGHVSSFLLEESNLSLLFQKLGIQKLHTTLNTKGTNI